MSDASAAAEHLKVIRRMMERATVYRVLSAPAAIFGGLVACATAAYFLWRAGNDPGGVRWREFFWTWVVALVVVDVFNTLLLWRRSKTEGEPFFSPADGRPGRRTHDEGGADQRHDPGARSSRRQLHRDGRRRLLVR